MELNSILLGERIKKVRKEAGLTTAQFAELCDFSYVYARKIESGGKTPSLSMFIHICNVLKVSPEYLLADSLEFENGKEDWEKYETAVKKYTPKQLNLIEKTIAGIINFFEDRSW